MKKALMMAIAACVMASPAMAKDMTPAEKEAKMEKKTDMWFSKIDSNSDGMISKEEHTAFGDKMFSDTDKDGNGSISKEEMKDMKKKEHDEMKDKMDDDKKGE